MDRCSDIYGMVIAEGKSSTRLMMQGRLSCYGEAAGEENERDDYF